jgi:diadenosine tetraphosphatase ApaH/serine/threonine PP2A family protein phosphatase
VLDLPRLRSELPDVIAAAERARLVAHRGLATWGERRVRLDEFRAAAAAEGRALSAAEREAARGALLAQPRDETPVEGPFARIAVCGGVYSNWQALEACLDDAARRGAEAVFCLGDLGGFGPHPDRVFPLLRAAGVRVIQGNYDGAIAAGHADCGCGYTDPRDNHWAQLSYAYTLARTSSEHRRFMAALPAHRRLRLGEAEALLCHGSPRATAEFLWESTTPDGLAARLLDDARAQVILCTHSGIKWHRRLPDGRHLVNVGVIGRPENDGTPRVWYTLLTAETGRELDVEFVPVHYDHETLAKEMEAEALPAEFVETVRTGWWTTCLEVLPGRERARGRF